MRRDGHVLTCFLWLLYGCFMTSEASFFKKDQKKEISHPLVLVAGVSEYERIKDLSGATGDMHRLHRLFANFYGYKVLTTCGLQEKKAGRLLKEEFISLCRHAQNRLKNNIEGYDALIIAFCGIQKENNLLFSDGEALSLKEIETYFNLKECPNIRRMPKICIQAARERPIPLTKHTKKDQLLLHQGSCFLVTSLDAVIRKLGNHRHGLMSLVKKKRGWIKMTKRSVEKKYVLGPLCFRHSFYFFLDLVRQMKKLRQGLSCSSYLEHIKLDEYALRRKQIAYLASIREVNLDGMMALFSFMFEYMKWDLQKIQQEQKEKYRKWLRAYKVMPLQKAFAQRDIEMVKILTMKGHDREKDDDNKHALHYAVRYDWEEMIQWLIDVYQVDINVRDKDHWHALHYAAWKGKKRVIRLLLETYKVDVDVRDKDGWHVLHVAAKFGQERVVKWLIGRYHVDINVRDKSGKHALHFAVWDNKKGMIRLLIHTYKVDVNVRDQYGSHALHYAAINGHGRVIEWFLRTYKIDINIRNQEGTHTLHIAAQYGQKYLIKLLLETYNVDIDATNDQKQTPLHIAAQYGQKGTYALLVNLGANLESKDSNGKTPREWKTW